MRSIRSLKHAALITALVVAPSCGRNDEPVAQLEAVTESAEETPHQAFLEGQLKALFAAETVEWKVNQREHVQVETRLPGGSKRIWTLAVIPYPAQAQVFQQDVEKKRGKPEFEESLGLGADWGKDDDTVLRVVVSADLVFQLSVVDDLPFLERIEAMKGELGQRWRSDAVTLAKPLIKHLQSVSNS
jgi:hypothetical protein